MARLITPETTEPDSLSRVTFHFLVSWSFRGLCSVAYINCSITVCGVCLPIVLESFLLRLPSAATLGLPQLY